WSATCGAPFSAEGDTSPPTVSIVSPTTGTRVDSDPDGAANVRVTVDADDGGGSGVREVQLVVDGTARGTADTTAPWEFQLRLASGIYEIAAIAVDEADQSSQSASVMVGVDETPDPAGDGGSPDAGEGGGAQGDGGEEG